MKQSLSHLTIADLSSHLPGPYASHLLSQMGARIIKLIKKDTLMPFERFPRDEHFRLFHVWYKKFNQNKSLQYYNDETEMTELLKTCQGVITNKCDFHFSTHLKVTRIVSSLTDNYPRHDLNVLAESGYLAHDLNPPTLPWAGILFGEKIARVHLAQHLPLHLGGEQDITLTLQELASEFTQNFLPSPPQTPCLHSGGFACYRLYQLADNSWVALAAIEKKYWDAFCDYFKIELDANERFSTNPKVIEVIASTLKKYNKDDLCECEAFCLSKVKNT